MPSNILNCSLVCPYGWTPKSCTYKTTIKGFPSRKDSQQNLFRKLEPLPIQKKKAGEPLFDCSNSVRNILVTILRISEYTYSEINIFTKYFEIDFEKLSSQSWQKWLSSLDLFFKVRIWNWKISRVLLLVLCFKKIIIMQRSKWNNIKCDLEKAKVKNCNNHLCQP